MPDNSLAPPNMPWLWQPNSQPGQPNGLGPPMLNYAAPPDPNSQGAGVAAAGQRAWQWLQDQRAESVRQGLLDPDTGLPTQKGIVQGVGQTAQGVMMGTTAPGDVPPPGIVAYHGSPHSFDQFDTSKIGTGEGAQAYGHGLYFAEGEGVARQYRDVLASRSETDTPEGMAKFWANMQGGHEGGISHLEFVQRQIDQYPNNYPPGEADKINQAIQYLKSGGDLKPAGGHMYQVNIGAEPEHFLDWDKPLSEQHPVVQDALAKAAPEIASGENIPASLAYYRLAGKLTGNKSLSSPEAAEALRAAGIPGIRYLDQGSRAARDPIKLVEGKPYDPSDPTHIASHAMDMAGGDRTAAAAIADRHAQLRAAEGDTAGADVMRQASTLLQSPRTIPPMTEGQPPGTHNYVVFDANTIEILRKYGIAGLIAGGGAAAAATQQQQPSQ